VSWGIYTTKLEATEKRMDILETKYENILEMKTDIEVIKTDINYIKKTLDTKI
jgi:hypothetical protein